MNDARKPVIAILGGTGDLGSGLAAAWSKAGYNVVVGSRSREKAVAFAESCGGGVSGDDNAGAARQAGVVVLAVPYANHAPLLQEIGAELSGKIVVTAVVPLVPPKVSTVQLPPDGSAALEARRILGDCVRLVSAFHNVGAAKLRAGGKAECDVLVFSDDREARDLVIGLADIVASRGVSGGALANSVAAEAMTSILIGINRQYQVSGAGISISGLPAREARPRP